MSQTILLNSLEQIRTYLHQQADLGNPAQLLQFQLEEIIAELGAARIEFLN
jgi:hypothetical protein